MDRPLPRFPTPVMSRPLIWGTALCLGAALWVGFAFRYPTLTSLIILLGPLGFLALLHRPLWGLYGLLVLLPYISTQPGLGFQIGNYVLPGLILASLLLRHLWLHEPPRRLPQDLEAWFILFILAVVFTSCFSEHSRVFKAPLQIALLVVFLTGLQTVWNPETARRGFLVYAAALIPLALYGLWLVQTVGLTALFFASSQPQRLATFYQSSNTMAVYLGHGVVICMGYLLVPRKRHWTLELSLRNLVVLGVGLLLTAALLGTFSRGAMLYIGVAGTTLIVIYRKVFFTVMGILGGVILILISASPPWLTTLLRLDSGVTYRDSLWKAGLEIFKNNLWTGVGLGSGVFELHRGPYLSGSDQLALADTIGGGAHNLILQKAAQMGILGVLFSIALLILCLRLVPAGIAAYRRGSWIYGAAAAGITGMIARSFFESGGIMAQGRINDSLMFFLFVLTLAALKGRAPTA